MLLWFNLQYFIVLLPSKKINTVNTVKLFFYYKLEKSSFLLIFFKFVKTIYSYKRFILSFIPIKCCGIAHITVYKRMIVLDSIIENIVISVFGINHEITPKRNQTNKIIFMQNK